MEVLKIKNSFQLAFSKERKKKALQFKNQKGTTFCRAELKVNLKFHSDSNLNLNRRNIGRFRRFVDEMELKDVPLHGRYSRGVTRERTQHLRSWTVFW